MMETFWMVYVNGKSSPTKKHYSFSEVKQEAERLCLIEHKEVYILEATAMCSMSNIVWEKPNRFGKTTELTETHTVGSPSKTFRVDLGKERIMVP